ncbi:hypothetical protein [Burkholderia cepacia]|uniref:hypothetical protein n=1 Tax=Burkholderia cepacia TaxID=292 RepID=UPI00158D736E|nr:hypothetical protein [Burkholderia cepacia]
METISPRTAWFRWAAWIDHAAASSLTLFAALTLATYVDAKYPSGWLAHIITSLSLLAGSVEFSLAIALTVYISSARQLLRQNRADIADEAFQRLQREKILTRRAVVTAWIMAVAVISSLPICRDAVTWPALAAEVFASGFGMVAIMLGFHWIALGKYRKLSLLMEESQSKPKVGYILL